MKADSSKVRCFTYPVLNKMAARIKHADICDSTSKYQDRVIMRGDSILGHQNGRFNDLSTLSSSYKKERDRARKKLLGIPVVFGGGFFLGYILR